MLPCSSFVSRDQSCEVSSEPKYPVLCMKPCILCLPSYCLGLQTMEFVEHRWSVRPSRAKPPMGTREAWKKLESRGSGLAVRIIVDLQCIGATSCSTSYTMKAKSSNCLRISPPIHELIAIPDLYGQQRRAEDGRARWLAGDLVGRKITPPLNLTIRQTLLKIRDCQQSRCQGLSQSRPLILSFLDQHDIT